MGLATLTGAAIANLAFAELAKTGAAEAAKQAVGGAVEVLRGAIRKRFAGQAKAEGAIAKAEQGDAAALNKLAVYLDDEMEADPQFSQNLRQIAQQIVNIGQQTQTTVNQTLQDDARGAGVINNSGSGDVVFGDKGDRHI